MFVAEETVVSTRPMTVFVPEETVGQWCLQGVMTVFVPYETGVSTGAMTVFVPEETVGQWWLQLAGSV